MDILSHNAFVRGNDRTGSLSSKAHINGPLTLDRTDILQTARDSLMKSEMVINEITRVILLECCIANGVSIRDRGRGRNQRVTNQDG